MQTADGARVKVSQQVADAEQLQRRIAPIAASLEAFDPHQAPVRLRRAGRLGATPRPTAPVRAGLRRTVRGVGERLLLGVLHPSLDVPWSHQRGFNHELVSEIGSLLGRVDGLCREVDRLSRELAALSESHRSLLRQQQGGSVRPGSAD